MCSTLTGLFDSLQVSDLAVSRSDVIRVACNSCGRWDVCPQVTEQEFELRAGNQAKPLQVSNPQAKL